MQTQKNKIIKELLSNTFNVFLAGILFVLALFGVCSFFFRKQLLSFLSSLDSRPYVVYIAIVVGLLPLFMLINSLVKKYNKNIKPSFEQMEILDKIAIADYSKYPSDQDSKSALVQMMDEHIKNLYRQLKSLQNEVDASQELQNIILEQLNEGIIATNEQGEIQLETHLVREMLQSKRFNERDKVASNYAQSSRASLNSKGIATTNTSANNLERFISVRNVNYSKVWEIMSRAIATEDIVIEDFEINVDGQDKVIQVFASPIDDKNLKGALAVIGDVTMMKSLERQRQDFVANVSHELKTPLTSILGYIELAKSPDRTIDEIRQFQEIIAIEAQHLRELIGDLLELAEIENRQKPAKVEEDQKKEWVYFYQVIDEIFGQLSRYAKQQDVKLLLEVDPETRIEANYTRIKQLFFNLISNAIKYNKPGGYVRVGTGERSSQGGSQEVFVEDNGIGIPRAEQNRIFERFYRVDKSRAKNVEGTGLGLAIVKHTANLYNASVTLESELGKGSKFTITFPKK